ncbi:MAG: hypothetical protein HRU13_12835, partial [Phycisphaerales bacterium]|nr:hypothetical protein [Phycisphaerales bacterium]
MNLTLNPVLANLGGSDTRENGLAQYRGILSGTFLETLPATAFAMRESAQNTTEHEFYGIGRAHARAYHPGAPNQGQRRPVRERRTIPADNAFIRSDAIVTDMDEFLSHIPTMSRYAENQAHAVQVEIEKRVLRMLTLGARQPERVSVADGSDAFDSGILVRQNATTLANAFPVTLQGARNVEQRLQEVREELNKRNIRESAIYAHMGPYL